MNAQKPTIICDIDMVIRMPQIEADKILARIYGKGRGAVFTPGIWGICFSLPDGRSVLKRFSFELTV